jgi:hypothetical protein
MMYRTDDPLADFARKEAEEEAWLKTRPWCCECRRRIQDEICFQFDGKLICRECLEENHQKCTDDFVKDELY